MTTLYLSCLTVLTILFMFRSGFADDIEGKMCQAEKPFKCRGYAMCASFQEYCSSASRTKESCFNAKDESSIRQECLDASLGLLSIDPACRYACMDKFSDLAPFPICEYHKALPISSYCHDHQWTGFQTYCKGNKVVSCFPGNLPSEKLDFCRGEQGKNLLSRAYDPCKYACVDLSPPLLGNIKLIMETLNTSDELDKPGTTSSTYQKKHSEVIKENSEKGRTAPECPSFSVKPQDIVIAVLLTVVLYTAMVAVFLVKIGILVISPCQKKQVDNEEAAGTGAAGPQGINNDNLNQGTDDIARGFQRREQQEREPTGPLENLGDQDVHQPMLLPEETAL